MFAIRISGTNNFVCNIDPSDTRCHPPGSVGVVSGLGDHKVLKFSTKEEVEEAARLVFEIEGFYTSIEEC